MGLAAQLVKKTTFIPFYLFLKQYKCMENLSDNNKAEDQEKDYFDSLSMPSEGVINTILDFSWKEYQQVFDDKCDLEIKSSIILASIGVIIGFIVTRPEELNLIFTYLGVFVLMVSAASCVYILKIRKYKRFNAIGTFKNISDMNLQNNEYSVKLGLIRTLLCKCNDSNKKIYPHLAEIMEFAMILFVMGVTLLLFSFLLGHFF